MRTMLQCRMIGLMGFGALAVLGASYLGGPGTSTLLAQVRERDAARIPTPESTSGSRLEGEKLSDSAQQPGLPERARVTAVRLFSSQNYIRIMMEIICG